MHQYDPDEDRVDSPFIADTDLVGLYEPNLAAVASRLTACDPGSGPTRIDD